MSCYNERIYKGTDPEYLRKLQELKDLRDKRIFMAETFREYEVTLVTIVIKMYLTLLL